MESSTIVNNFEALRRNIKTVDGEIKSMLPLLSGRLQSATNGYNGWEHKEALTAMKRELRNWNITKQCWNVPR